MFEHLTQKNWPWGLAIAIVLVLFASQSVRIARPVDTLPIGDAEDVEALGTRDDLNVLFVLVDTLRSDRLGSYGYERDTSPVFDALAQGGIRFDRHLAQSSWTKCSMASLWTGFYPSGTGVTRLDHGLPDQAIMPAEVFQDAGFRTVGIWRNGWVSPTFGFAQGFDVYSRPVPAPVPAGVRRDNPTVQFGGSDLDVVASAAEFMSVAQDDRWFAYLHLMDVHEYTYSEETALFGSGQSDLYDNSIRYVNDAMGLLRQALIDTGNLDRTLIIIASDHGEAFRERGLEGHARAVYRESTETPFIVGLPFELEQGIVVSSRSFNVDLWPTIFDLLGLPELDEVDGVSRRPEILAAAHGETDSESEDTKNEIGYAHLDQTWGTATALPTPMVAVVEGRYRYIESTDSQGGPVVELFDSREDPKELKNLAVQQPDVVGRLHRELESYLGREPVWSEGVPSLKLDELELNQLRALGYSIP